MNLKIGNMNIENSTCETLLGVKADNILNLNKHLDGVIKKASRKVSVLSRIFPFMDLTKRHFLTDYFFASQFIYCPLTWMYYSKTANNKINKLHARCQRIVYNDNKLSFKETSVDAFEELIKNGNLKCPCWLCESYIQNLGFI